MAQYKANAEQNVLLNQPIVFDSSIPCPRGNVIHENGSGIFYLRGPAYGCCNRFARYEVTSLSRQVSPSDRLPSQLLSVVKSRARADRFSLRRPLISTAM